MPFKVFNVICYAYKTDTDYDFAFSQTIRNLPIYIFKGKYQ